MPRDRVIVVGAGIGGLVAALRLAHAGLVVTVLERALQPGGKMRQVALDGRLLDAGPTVFTLRSVFDALFDEVGERLDDHLCLQPLRTLARHAWADGAQLDLFADLDASVAAIGEFAGAAEASRYRAFCARAERVFRALDRSFMQAQRPSPLSLVARAGLRGLPGLLQIAPFASLWHELQRAFGHPRLRQLFARYATYCGSSPYLAPATLMLVAHAERAGVWQLQGGMHSLAACLASLARARGAQLLLGMAVKRILVQHGAACGVQLESGERLMADHVVFNGDVSALAQGSLGDAARRAVHRNSPQRSLSALTWNLVATTRGFPLAHHTVFFSDAYGDEFDDIFVRGRLPRAPTVYVCALDRQQLGVDHESPPAPADERLLCLVNAPACGDRAQLSAMEIRRCEQISFEHLAACGLRVDRDRSRQITTTPADFHRLFPGTGGALYGQATHGWRASFSRCGSRSRMPGLYLAGGSVHPGPGVPMVALSGQLAAQRVLQAIASRTSIWSWRAAATPGGISTR
jgi:1-hydroxycarotenoid 3,4-desaturase